MYLPNDDFKERRRECVLFWSLHLRRIWIENKVRRYIKISNKFSCRLAIKIVPWRKILKTNLKRRKQTTSLADMGNYRIQPKIEKVKSKRGRELFALRILKNPCLGYKQNVRSIRREVVFGKVEERIKPTNVAESSERGICSP